MYVFTGQIETDDLPMALSPPAFFVLPMSSDTKHRKGSAFLDDINNALDRLVITFVFYIYLLISYLN